MSKARLEAVIWDMDGVIADTVDYHYEAWKEEFAKKGVDYTKEHFLRFFGQRNDTIIKDALGKDIAAGGDGGHQHRQAGKLPAEGGGAH